MTSSSPDTIIPSNVVENRKGRQQLADHLGRHVGQRITRHARRLELVEQLGIPSM